MKKFLKPLLLNVSGVLLMGAFCCNVGAMKIEVPLLYVDPNIADIGTAVTCENCNFIVVQITEDGEYNYLFRAHFQDSQNSENSLNCMHSSQYFYGDEAEYNYWGSYCNKEIIIPINNLPNDALNKFISIASPTNTSFLMDDFLNKHKESLSRDYKEYIDKKDYECLFLEDSILEGHILKHLKNYLQQAEANQLS